MRCEDARLAVFFDDATADATLHVQACPGCRAAIADARSGMDAASDGALAPPHLEAAVLTAVRKEVRPATRRRPPLALLAAAAGVALLAVIGGIALQAQPAAVHRVSLVPARGGTPPVTVVVTEEEATLRFVADTSALAPGTYEMWVGMASGGRVTAGRFSPGARTELVAQASWDDWVTCGIDRLDGGVAENILVANPYAPKPR